MAKKQLSSQDVSSVQSSVEETSALHNFRPERSEGLQSRCEKGSRRWQRLQAVKSKVIAECFIRTRDLNHKITRKAVDWCIEHGVKTLAIGDVTGIAQNTNNEKRLNRKNRQKISQWEFYKQRQYLEYKCSEVGIETVLEKENGTSKTCPKCGRKHKPNGRNFSCPVCDLKIHRDVVGACNIRTKHLTGVLNGDDNFKSPTVKYLRIDPDTSGLKSSSAAGVSRRRNSPHPRGMQAKLRCSLGVPEQLTLLLPTPVGTIQSSLFGKT
jgi:IS605 OrfB family transposase